MEKILISSIKDNFFQRARNPLISLWILVILYHKWDVIYKIFTIAHTEKNAEIKVNLINLELFSIITLKESIWYLGCALLILLITHLLGSFAKFLSDFFNKNITPFFEKINDKLKTISGNYSSQDYEALLIKYDLLKEKSNQLETRINELEAERDHLFIRAKKINLDLLGKDDNFPQGNGYCNRLIQAKVSLDELVRIVEIDQTAEKEGKILHDLISTIKDDHDKFTNTQLKFDLFLFFISVYRFYSNFRFNEHLLKYLKEGRFSIQNEKLIDHCLTLLTVLDKHRLSDKIPLIKSIEFIDVKHIKNYLFFESDDEKLPLYIENLKR